MKKTIEKWVSAAAVVLVAISTLPQVAEATGGGGGSNGHGPKSDWIHGPFAEAAFRNGGTVEHLEDGTEVVVTSVSLVAPGTERKIESTYTCLRYSYRKIQVEYACIPGNLRDAYIARGRL